MDPDGENVCLSESPPCLLATTNQTKKEEKITANQNKQKINKGLQLHW